MFVSSSIDTPVFRPGFGSRQRFNTTILETCGCLLHGAVWWRTLAPATILLLLSLNLPLWSHQLMSFRIQIYFSSLSIFKGRFIFLYFSNTYSWEGAKRKIALFVHMEPFDGCAFLWYLVLSSRGLLWVALYYIITKCNICLLKLYKTIFEVAPFIPLLWLLQHKFLKLLDIN